MAKLSSVNKNERRKKLVAQYAAKYAALKAQAADKSLDDTERLMARLKEWTGQPWLVAAEGGGGAESLLEREKREVSEQRSEVEADPFVKLVMTTFPGAEIVEIRSLAAPQVTAPVEEPDED